MFFDDISNFFGQSFNDVITGVGTAFNDLGMKAYDFGTAVVGGVNDFVSQKVLPTMNSVVTEAPNTIKKVVNYAADLGNTLSKAAGTNIKNVLGKEGLGGGVGDVTSGLFGTSWMTGPVILAVAGVAGLIALKV